MASSGECGEIRKMGSVKEKKKSHGKGEWGRRGEKEKKGMRLEEETAQV